MLERIAVILTSYNMPERTDALCKHLLSEVEWPLSLFVVDNGSDIRPPSQYTTLRLDKNRQTTGGWLAGLKQAQGYGDWLGYLFLITSAEFTYEDDPIAELCQYMAENPDVAGIHPALTVDSTSDWPHLFPIPGHARPRQVWHIDNICALWRASWFDSVGGFDPALTYAWGVDLETSWKARRDGLKLMVHDGTRIKKVSNIGYQMERMNMTAQEREQNAGSEMEHVLEKKYGRHWWERMTGEFITFEMALPGEYRPLERISAWN